MAEWRRAHPKATLTEIEDGVFEAIRKLIRPAKLRRPPRPKPILANSKVEAYSVYSLYGIRNAVRAANPPRLHYQNGPRSPILETPTPEPLLHSVNLTKARELSPLFNEAVVDEQPVVITRGTRQRAVLASQGSIERMLAPYRVHVDVLPEADGGFTLWVLELDIGGTGPTLEAARDELLSAVRSYIRDYHEQFSFYRHLPDMAAREPYVFRLSLAQDNAELVDLLFSETANTPAPKYRPRARAR